MQVQSATGYSASIKAPLVVNGEPIKVAKTNGQFVVLRQPSEAPAGTLADLLVIIDDRVKSRRVWLVDGIAADQSIVYCQAV